MGMNLEGIMGSLPDPPNNHGGNGSVAVDTNSPSYASKSDIGPNRMVWVDELEDGASFFSPQRCPGTKTVRNPFSGEATEEDACGFPASRHIVGEYHEGTVIRTRDEEINGIATRLVIFENEEGDQQAFGPVPAWMPIRLKLKLELGDTDPGKNDFGL